MNPIQIFAIYAIPVLFAITLHEVAHGWVAEKLGDKTARMLGRITINPIKHIDPIGTIIVPILMYSMAGFAFGWAKPVPITWQNLKNPKRDISLVALAGPVANLLMAFFWAIWAKIGFSIQLGSFNEPMVLMGYAGIMINLVLMIFNLIPLPPLDGSRVMASLLPGPLSYKYMKLEPYGFFIVVALLATGILSTIILPPLQWSVGLIATVFGLR